MSRRPTARHPQFTNPNAAAELIWYLNADPDPRILKIVGLAQELAAKGQASTLFASANYGFPEKNTELLDRLNVLLCEFSAHPQLFAINKRKWFAFWSPSVEPADNTISVSNDADYARSWMNENMLAVFNILALGNDRKLHMLDHCRTCEKWIMRRQEDQRFCSVRCRQHHHLSREDVRAHRNKLRRENYRNEVKRAKIGLAIVRKRR